MPQAPIYEKEHKWVGPCGSESVISISMMMVYVLFNKQQQTKQDRHRKKNTWKNKTNQETHKTTQHKTRKHKTKATRNHNKTQYKSRQIKQNKQDKKNNKNNTQKHM